MSRHAFVPSIAGLFAGLFAGVFAGFIAVALPPGAAGAQEPAGCSGRAACAEVTSFVATVGDFRTSVAGRMRIVAFTLRFQNRTARPLRLAYVRGSGVVVDDQGNRYVPYGPSGVRAIGEITESTFDPKFVLAPGESSDARFEMAWQPERAGQIFGTTFEGDVTVREIDQVDATQFRSGREHVLHFRDLGGAQVATPDPSPAPPSPGADDPPAAPVTAERDPCEGRSRCSAAGPFVAEVSSVVPSSAGRHHTARVELKIQNRAPQPLILGYKSGSGSIVDELGNRYYWGRAGTYDLSAQGIGTVTGRQADAQFALRPGETRRASFTLIRYEALRQQIGTSFTHDLALVQLEVLPGNQVRSVREYALNFPSLSAGSAPNAAEALTKGKALSDRLRGKKKQP